ncbi:MAG: peptide chain release factor N(5)-glutamine methyltransferase [bacterium]
MRIKEAYQLLKSSISHLYENRESSNIAELVMEDLTGWERSKRIIYHDQELNHDQLERFEQYTSALKMGKPVQYVLGSTWFGGMRFQVDERVLIPRPETEELVEEVKKTIPQKSDKQEHTFKAIDIGTGSGCIAIALKKHFPSWEVWGIDVSNDALTLAEKNAETNQADIIFQEIDILAESKVDQLPAFDLIVSNPPYIPHADKNEMTDLVLKHEPHQALFITNNDPLQFYRSIIDFSAHHLLRGGWIFFETHADFSKDVTNLLEENEFEETQIKKDMQGKERIVISKKIGASL